MGEQGSGWSSFGEGHRVVDTDQLRSRSVTLGLRPGTESIEKTLGRWRYMVDVRLQVDVKLSSTSSSSRSGFFYAAEAFPHLRSAMQRVSSALNSFAGQYFSQELVVRSFVSYVCYLQELKS